MNIQSVAQFRQAQQNSRELTETLAAGGTVRISQSAIPNPDTTEATEMLNVGKDVPLRQSMAFQLPAFERQEDEYKMRAEVHRQMSEIYEKHAGAINPEADEPFSFRKTAGRTVVVGAATYTVGVLATALMSAGKSSGNPWMSTVAIAAGALGAILGADSANEGYVMDIGKDAVEIYKGFKG
jgi:hypothetical protein